MSDGEAETPEAGVPDPQAQEETAPETIFDGVEVEESPKPEEDVIDTPTKPPEEEAEEKAEEGERPDWLPEKFKTPEDLVKAYNEMGTKIREKNEPPESYEIKVKQGEEEQEIELSETEVEVFKDANLTNDQAQKLTQYFHEHVIPEIVNAKAEVEKERLGLDWNMDPSSSEFTQQLAKVKSWAQQNLPEAAVTELSRSAAGVKTLSNLMEQGNQGHKVTGNTASSRPDRSQLQDLMNDERYWKGDEDYRRYVQEQFQRAFD